MAKRKCTICNRVIQTAGKHCPTCKRLAKAVKKIPKNQRKMIKRITKLKGISIRRLLA